MTGLEEKLKAMAEADLRLRSELAASGALFGGYHPDMEALHIENARALESIIDAIGGWPHEGIAGKEGAEAAWLIAQHAISLPDFQRRVLALLQESAPHVPPAHAAYLEDRIRAFEGRPQLYGTQFDWDDNGVLTTGPIEDEANVDRRRADVGLPPLAEKIAEMTRRAESEGEKPPVDAKERKKKAEMWARKVGWR